MADGRGNAVDGEIIVCYAGKGSDRDLEFTGDPTPDMIPLDDEAKEISARLGSVSRPEDMPEGGYAGKILEGLSKQLAEAMTAQGVAANPQIDRLIESQNKFMEQMTAVLAALGNQAVPAGPKPAERRV